jgi:hypothetical protein
MSYPMIVPESLFIVAHSPIIHADRPEVGPYLDESHTFHGARRSRVRILSASASSMNDSVAGLKRILRPSFQAMAAAWQATWP